MKRYSFLLVFWTFFLSTLITNLAFAGAKVEFGDDAYITVGAGLRYQITSVEDSAPNGSDDSLDFDLANMRLYVGGKINELIGFTFNTERFNGSEVEVLDAIAQFEFSPAFNIWLGRLLTPADRIEMNGPFYALTWNQYDQPLYPSDQDAPGDGTDGGPAGSVGRDEGITFWGTLGKFQYALGAFDGLESAINEKDSPLFAGRFAYNFLNMEQNPAYYTSSTYYGGLDDVFTVAVSFQTQDDAVGFVDTVGGTSDRGDFFGYTIDALYENLLGNGDVLTIEGEWKDFDTDTVAAAPAGAETFSLFDGDSYFASAAYLFHQNFVYGKFQPYLRYVENNPDEGDDSDLIELGLNYIMEGHNARLNLTWRSGDANVTGAKGEDLDALLFGVQLQL